MTSNQDLTAYTSWGEAVVYFMCLGLISSPEAIGTTESERMVAVCYIFKGEVPYRLHQFQSEYEIA